MRPVRLTRSIVRGSATTSGAADLLRHLMSAQRVSDPSLARMIGATPAAVGTWRRGSRGPSLDKLSAACAALGYELYLSAVPSGQGHSLPPSPEEVRLLSEGRRTTETLRRYQRATRKIMADLAALGFSADPLDADPAAER